MLLLLVVGDVLGAGIYALVGEVGGRVGGAIWTSFLLAIGVLLYGINRLLTGPRGPLATEQLDALKG
jgi:hypothetical protein